MWLPILIGFFFDSFNFFSLRIFVTLGHKSNFVISLCVFLQRNSHQGSLLAFFSYEVFLTLSRTDHWDAHYVVTQIIELKYVPCSFWFKRRNLNEMFTWEKDKTFVTHSCSQFSFSFKSPQTGTTSGKYWGAGVPRRSISYISFPAPEAMIVKHSVSHHVQIPYRLKTEASILLWSILWWKSNRLNAMNTRRWRFL